jgi:hypothetical protein
MTTRQKRLRTITAAFALLALLNGAAAAAEPPVLTEARNACLSAVGTAHGTPTFKNRQTAFATFQFDNNLASNVMHLLEPNVPFQVDASGRGFVLNIFCHYNWMTNEVVGINFN